MKSGPRGVSTDVKTDCTSHTPRNDGGKKRSEGPPPMASHARSATAGSLLADASGVRHAGSARSAETKPSSSELLLRDTGMQKKGAALRPEASGMARFEVVSGFRAVISAAGAGRALHMGTVGILAARRRCVTAAYPTELIAFPCTCAAVPGFLLIKLHRDIMRRR